MELENIDLLDPRLIRIVSAIRSHYSDFIIKVRYFLGILNFKCSIIFFRYKNIDGYVLLVIFVRSL